MLAKRGSACGGFTLVELLTVGAIIIILATLVTTAIFSTNEAARGARCRGNLSQIHKLIMNYTTQYGGYLPAFWHERWVGELGLAGGMWRDDIQKLKQKPHIKEMWDWWEAFLAMGGRTYPPPSDTSHPEYKPCNSVGKGLWNQIRTRMGKIWHGDYGHLENCDDVNPLMPTVWNNYQQPGHYLGYTPGVQGYSQGARPVLRSPAPFIICPSDVSLYRCDQGCYVSYMGLAKYGWWHRGGTTTATRYFEYHQIEEVENLHKGVLLAETEPGTWQYGNCG